METKLDLPLFRLENWSRDGRRNARESSRKGSAAAARFLPKNVFLGQPLEKIVNSLSNFDRQTDRQTEEAERIKGAFLHLCILQ